MNVLFSERLQDFFREFFILTDGIAISAMEPPLRFSQYDQALNFTNSVSYPPDGAYPHFCRSIRQASPVVDRMCLECDRVRTERCMAEGKTENTAVIWDLGSSLGM